MKVLIIYYGGLAEDGKSIFREYVKQGIDLSVIVPKKIVVSKAYSPSGFLEYKAEDNNFGYKIFPVPLINSGKHHYLKLFSPFLMYKAIKEAKPDIIHVFNEYLSTHLTETIFFRNFLYGGKVPILIYVYENIPFNKKPLKINFSFLFFRDLARLILKPLKIFYHKRNISGVVGCNNESLKIIKETGFNGPMKRIFWGIDLKKFYPKDKINCRKKLGISKDRYKINRVFREDSER